MSAVISDDFLFEVIVGIVLKGSGFTRVSRGAVQGRGGSHQTDSYGDYYLDIPFVYKVHLLAEAKYYAPNNRLSIGAGRDVLARVTDIDQKYTSADYDLRDDPALSRRTIRGALFSASGFSGTTLRFCYAHGIYCVDFPVRLQNTTTAQLIGKIRELLDSVSSTDRFPSSLDAWKAGQEAFFKLVRKEDELWKMPDDDKQHLRDLIEGFLLKDPDMTEARELQRLNIVTLKPSSEPVVLERPVEFEDQFSKVTSDNSRSKKIVSSPDTIESAGTAHSDTEGNGFVEIVPFGFERSFRLYVSKERLASLTLLEEFELEGIYRIGGSRRVITLRIRNVKLEDQPAYDRPSIEGNG